MGKNTDYNIRRPVKFHEGRIEIVDSQPAEFEGLSVIALLETMAESSWDFPSAMIALGLEPSDFPDYEPVVLKGNITNEHTMYPGPNEGEALSKIAHPTDPKYRDAFVTRFLKISWDT